MRSPTDQKYLIGRVFNFCLSSSSDLELKKKRCGLLHSLDAVPLKQAGGCPATLASTKIISKTTYECVLLKWVFDKSYFFRENGNKQNIIY